MLVQDGILLLKYWFSINDDEQEKRFQERIDNEERRWKMSPMDIESRNRWVEYSKAKDTMFAKTHIPEAHGSPWRPMTSARPLELLRHILSKVPRRHDTATRQDAKAPEARKLQTPTLQRAILCTQQLSLQRLNKRLRHRRPAFEPNQPIDVPPQTDRWVRFGQNH